MLERMQRKGNPPTLLVGLQIGATTVKAVWRFLKKLKIEIPFDPGIPLLGIYPKKTRSLIQRHMHPYAYNSTIYNSQDIGAT